MHAKSKKLARWASDLEKFQKKIKIRFRSKRYLKSAFTHPSYDHENFLEIKSDFERLEFFGDSILNFAVCEKLFAIFPKATEGNLSRLRSTLVSKKILSRISKKLGLWNLTLFGRNEQMLKDPYRMKLLADILEALIGAIYLECGMKTSRAFVWKYWNPYFNVRKLLALDPNPKSTLQEFTQRFYHSLPHYQIKPAKNGFVCKIKLPSRIVGAGKGTSKQESEEQAAQVLLAKLKKKKNYSGFFNKDSKSAIPV